MTELTSRERMLRTLNFQDTDHLPCCFISFTALRKRHQENMYELAKAERAMGLDSMLFIPIAPPNTPPTLFFLILTVPPICSLGN